MNILHIDSSILRENSVSRTLTADVVHALSERHPGSKVTYRDLAEHELQHLSGGHLAARGGTPVSASLDVAEGDHALEEFIEADVIVVGAPMYNFSVPSQLKAWLDRLAVAGKTFRYTPNGVEGLVTGKRVIIASTRGGAYSSGAAAALDHQESYLRAFFAFIGVTDVTFVRAENVARKEFREHSIEQARADASRVAA